MLVSPTIALFYMIAQVAAHTQLFFINAKSGEKQTCFRHKDATSANFPTTDVFSNDMQCGKSIPHTSVCEVEAGETITMVWGEHKPGDHFISSGHRGNPNVYMGARASDAPPSTGWFKIFEGKWASSYKWYNDYLSKTSPAPGYHQVTIPANLKPGNYFLRSEMSALHAAAAYPGIQFFIFCAAVTVKGNGDAAPSAGETVSIPGYLTPSSPGVVFNVNYQKLPDGTNIYDSEASGQVYPRLGPAVATLAAGSQSAPLIPYSNASSAANPNPNPPPSPITAGQQESSSSKSGAVLVTSTAAPQPPSTTSTTSTTSSTTSTQNSVIISATFAKVTPPPQTNAAPASVYVDHPPQTSNNGASSQEQQPDEYLPPSAESLPSSAESLPPSAESLPSSANSTDPIIFSSSSSSHHVNFLLIALPLLIII